MQHLQHFNKEIWRILKNICDSPQLIAKTNFAMRSTLPVKAFQEAQKDRGQIASLSCEKQFLHSARLSCSRLEGCKGRHSKMHMATLLEKWPTQVRPASPP